MDVLLFSMAVDPAVVWPIIFAVLIVVVGAFLAATRRKDRDQEQDRRAGLGCMAILWGPLVGAFLAGLAIHLGNVHPRDVQFTYYVFIGIGAIAGFMTGCAFAVTSLCSPRAARGKELPAKALEPRDEF